MGQVLIIKEVKIGKTGNGKNGPWTNYLVTFADGQKASTFDSKIANLTGKKIDAELVKDEKGYTNLKSWVLAGPPADNGKPVYNNPPIPPKTEREPVSRDNNINANVAIKEIGEAIRAKIETPDGLKELYWNWIKHSLGGAIPQPKQNI